MTRPQSLLIDFFGFVGVGSFQSDFLNFPCFLKLFRTSEPFGVNLNGVEWNKLFLSVVDGVFRKMDGCSGLTTQKVVEFLG